MNSKIKTIIRIKLLLAVVGLGVFGFASLFSQAPEAQSQWGYDCQNSPWMLNPSASVTVQNLTTGETVSAYADMYNYGTSPTINIDYGTSLSITVDGYTSDPNQAMYGGSVLYNNTEQYFPMPGTYFIGPVTVGGPATFIVTDCYWYSVSATVNINVNTPPSPTGDLKCRTGGTVFYDSCSVTYGGNVRFSWTSSNSWGDSTKTWYDTNKTSCSFSPGGWVVAASSQQLVSGITATTTYTLYCSGPGGTNVAVDTVVVTVSAPDVSVSCTPSLITIAPGSTATFSLSATSLNGFTGAVTWSTASGLPGSSSLSYTNNGASLTAGGSATTSAVIGTAVGTPAGTYNLVFSASTSVGTKTCGTVQLTVLSRPTATISAASTSLPYSGTTTITWSSSNATGCSVTKDGVTVPGWTGATGSQLTPALYTTTTYSITCSGDGGTSAPSSVTITVAVAPTATISASSTSIEYSASTNITWNSNNSSRCVLKKDGVTITTWTGTTGTQSTSALYASTTYSATCYNSVDYASNSPTVTITVAGAPTASISATATSVAYGGSTSINWGSDKATAGCVLKKDGVTITTWTGTTGTQSTGSLYANTTYTATCSNNAGASATATVTISVAGGPTATISATTTRLSYSGSTTISWNSTNATSCVLKKDGVTISGWTGLFGSQPTQSLFANTTYTATCSNSAGASASADVTIIVDGPPQPYISAASTNLPYSGSTTVTWSSSNSASCILKKDGVTIAGWTGTSGTQPTGSLYATTTYSATCNNSVGYSSNAATVTITVASSPTATISAASTSIAYGGSTSITWSSTNTTRCVLQKDGVTIATWTGVSGTQPTGPLYASTTYSAICYNSVDYPSNTATVRVNLPTPSIMVSCTPATYTVTQGSTASFALQSTSQNGFSGPVTWSLAGSAPTNSNLTYNNNGASLIVGGSATTTAIFQTQYTTPTGTYNFTFNTASTAATQSCGVQLIVSGAAPIITLTANGSLNNLTVNYYDYVTIAWSTTNATSCTISPTGWTGTSGSQVVGPVTGNLSYSATCTSASGLNSYASVFITVNDPSISNATVDSVDYTLSTDQNTLTTSASGKRPCYNPCTRDAYFDVSITGEVQKVTEAGTTITQWSGDIYYSALPKTGNWFWPASTLDSTATSTPNPVSPVNVSSWPNGNYRFCAKIQGSVTALYPNTSSTYSKCTAVFTINNRNFDLTCSVAVLNLSTTTTQGSVSMSTTASTGFTQPIIFNHTLTPTTGTLPTISYTNNGQIPNATTTALISITTATTPASYTIRFTGTGGSVTKFCDVQVNLIPSVSISATITDISTNNKYVPYNGSFSATWTSSFATSCSVSPYNWTGIAGTQTATNVTSDVTVTVNCTGPGGTASASITVPVGPYGTLKCNGLDDLCQVNYEATATLDWNSPNGTACSVKQGRTVLTSNTNTSGSIISPQITSQVQFDLICTRTKVATDILVDSVVVVVPDPGIILECTPDVTIYQGGVATFSLKATSVNGYTGTVTWSTTSALPTPTTTVYANNSPSLTKGSYAISSFSVQTQLATPANTNPIQINFTATPQSGAVVKSCYSQLTINAVPPTAPTLQASNAKCEEIQLQWNTPTNPTPTSYVIKRIDKNLNLAIYTGPLNSYTYKPNLDINTNFVDLLEFEITAYNYSVPSVRSSPPTSTKQTTLIKCEPKVDFSVKGISKAKRAKSVSWEPATGTYDITKAFAFKDGARFRVGDLVQFQIRVENNGTVPLENITVTDNPKNIALDANTPVELSTLSKGGSACGVVAQNITETSNLEVIIPSLNIAEVCTITVTGIVMDPTKTGTRPYYFQNTAIIKVPIIAIDTIVRTPVYSIDVDTGTPTRTETAP